AGGPRHHRADWARRRRDYGRRARRGDGLRRHRRRDGDEILRIIAGGHDAAVSPRWRRFRFSCSAWVCSGWMVRLEMAARPAEPWQAGLIGAIVFSRGMGLI